MTTTLLFLAGFFLLIKGADLLVEGASSLAKHFGIPAIVIGLTIVAFGTSAPELVVNIMASVQGNTDLAISNVVGSNTANILLILGLSAAVHPIIAKRGTIWKEVPFALLAVIALFFLVNDRLLDGINATQLSRGDAMVLMLFFTIFLVYTFELARLGKIEIPHDEKSSKKQPGWVSGSMILAGLIGLVVGGKWIVDGAIFFATAWGVSETLIGLTIVAVGTSLPELATSMVAAFKKQTDIAIGNVVGSNIFNIFFVLAVSGIIRPIPFSEAINQDITVMLLATFILFLSIARGKKNNTIARFEGIAFVLLYIIYVIYLVRRG